jgi:hypothetical protein
VRVYISPPTDADEAAFADAMRRSRRLHGRMVSMPETPEAYAADMGREAFVRDHERWAINAERWRDLRRRPV